MLLCVAYPPKKKIYLWNKKLEAGEKERDTGKAERGEGGEDKGRVDVGDWRGEGKKTGRAWEGRQGL